MKVLIADDDEAMRLLLREAWEIMQKANAPRLLILDWRMPKME